MESQFGHMMKWLITISLSVMSTPILAENTMNDVFSLSLEELSNLPVSSVAGIEQTWFTTPSAISVITKEDIRRSGHRNIAESLRLVPGMHVAQIESSSWAISSRGFNSQFSNKLLIQIDGRIQYNQLFGGAYWNTVDTSLNDIDTLEVIRGPGATLWGANAVNGVVNISTKHTKDTQGNYLEIGYGDEYQGFGEFRHGGKLNNKTHYRVWGKYENQDSLKRPDGTDRPDDWDFVHGGIRMDVDLDNNLSLMLHGDFFSTDKIGQGFISAPSVSTGADGRVDTGNLQFKLEHKMPDTLSGWSLQTYYQQENRKLGVGMVDNNKTIDIDYRNYFTMLDRHQIIWGAGYRFRENDVDSVNVLGITPSNQNTHLYSLFLQDTITLKNDRLFLMLGSKFEHNDFTGFEFQPNMRLWWTPNKKQTVWTSLSRSVRTPSLSDTSLVQLGTTIGNPALDSEELISGELGYRHQFSENLMIDIATFYNRYDDIIASGSTSTSIQGNNLSAQSVGIESSISWSPIENWILKASHTYLEVDQDGISRNNFAGRSPETQMQFHSLYNFYKNMELNSSLYFVDKLEDREGESYTRLDIGFIWRPSNEIELALWGQNLIDGSHREFNNSSDSPSPSEIDRSFYLKGSLEF